MNQVVPSEHANPPLGSIEPHALLLRVPPNTQLLYKVITVENLLRSIDGDYLHFNRVDSYADFPGADPHDGKQLPQDRHGNASARFEKNVAFSAADYYDKSRSRTYASCLSLENSEFIWQNYANGSARGKVCIVFEFGKLRKRLNQTLEKSALECGGKRCCQIFDLNYGVVEYVEWDLHRGNAERLPNPIRYTFFKDKGKYSSEKEFRISLSAVGIGQFVLKDGSTMQFPRALQVALDFRSAMRDGTIQQILFAASTDTDFVEAELHQRGIETSQA